VPWLTAVSLGPLAPTWSVPVVPTPVLVKVVEAIVPRVFVPVEEVKPVVKVVSPITEVPKVFVPVEEVKPVVNTVAPETVPIVAVPIEAVPINAVPIEAVPKVFVPVDDVKPVVKVVAPITAAPIVAVPVEAVKLVPNVTAPVSRLVPTTSNVPVLATPEVDTDRAEEVLSPSVMT